MDSEDILSFWFGTPATDAAALGGKMKRWYQGGPEMDREIRERFEGTVHEALSGALDGWTQTVRGRLALIIVLDQFPRSMFRDEPRCYAGDARAQFLAVQALDAGLDRGLAVEERNFMLMPLLHAEDLAMQERGVREIDRLNSDVADWQRPIFAMGIEQSRKYRDVIARFGRFPHRNAILGRASTSDEELFLRDWKERQPPSAFSAMTRKDG